jgi:hypothetical protein
VLFRSGSTAALLPGLLAADATAAVALSLTTSTVQAALGSAVSAPVAVLVKGAMQAMFWTKIKVGTLLLAFLAAAGVSIGTVLVQHHGAIAMTPVPEEARQPKKTEPTAAEPVVKDGLALQIAAPQAPFGPAEPVTFSFHYRNVSRRGFKLYNPTGDFGWLFRFENLATQAIWTASPGKGFQSPEPKEVDLQPQGELETQVVLGGKAEMRFSNGEFAHESLPPGKYRMTARVQLRNPWDSGNRSGAWLGEITTRPVEFEITAEKQQDAGARNALTDQQMAALAQETAKKGKFVELQEIRSKNQHLGGQWLLEQPFKQTRFWCVLQDRGLAAPKRDFLAVGRNGKVVYPFKAEEFTAVYQAEDRSKWTDKDYLQTAALRIHLTGTAHQDGWKILDSADDFMAIKFNMFPQNEAKRAAAAKPIEKLKVVKDQDTVQVRLWAWHLIGGGLREWTVEFKPTDVKASSKDHGRFGGGGYD